MWTPVAQAVFFTVCLPSSFLFWNLENSPPPLSDLLVPELAGQVVCLQEGGSAHGLRVSAGSSLSSQWRDHCSVSLSPSQELDLRSVTDLYPGIRTSPSVAVCPSHKDAPFS